MSRVKNNKSYFYKSKVGPRLLHVSTKIRQGERSLATMEVEKNLDHEIKCWRKSIRESVREWYKHLSKHNMMQGKNLVGSSIWKMRLCFDILAS